MLPSSNSEVSNLYIKHNYKVMNAEGIMGQTGFLDAKNIFV